MIASVGESEAAPWRKVRRDPTRGKVLVRVQPERLDVGEISFVDIETKWELTASFITHQKECFMIRIRIEVENGDDRIVYDRVGKDPDDVRAVMVGHLLGDAFMAISPGCVPSSNSDVVLAFMESAGMEPMTIGDTDGNLLRD